MKDNSLVLVSKPAPGVSVVTLNRPQKRNALSIALLNAFSSAIDQIHADKRQRVIIINGAGDSFCTGLDLEEASRLESAHESAKAMAKVLKTIAYSPLVTICIAQGSVLAGGAGVMSACDFAIASDEAKIGFPEVHRGLVAGLVMTFLCRLTTLRNVQELLLLGESIDSKKAHSIGIVNRVVPKDKLMPTALEFANQVMKGAPGALSFTKQLLRDLNPPGITVALTHALSYHMEVRTSPEAMEGIKAFLDKRTPNWNESLAP
jgi:methylglutaconyl-CoA hydratase